MGASVTGGRSVRDGRRYTQVGISVAIVGLVIALVVASQFALHREPTTTGGNGQTSAQHRSPAIDAAWLEAALDLGPVVSSLCTEQASGTPACYVLHAEGLWTRQEGQPDGTWLTVGLVIPRTEKT